MSGYTRPSPEEIIDRYLHPAEPIDIRCKHCGEPVDWSEEGCCWATEEGDTRCSAEPYGHSGLVVNRWAHRMRSTAAVHQQLARALREQGGDEDAADCHDAAAARLMAAAT